MKYSIIIVLILLISTSMAAVEKIALIIGNNIGLKDDIPLSYASDDAKRIYDVFTTIGGVAKERSYLLQNKPLSAIEDAFTEIAGRSKELKLNGKSVQVILYFSGHGSPEAFHINGKRFPIEDIQKRFENMNADLKILIADACNSGSLIQPKGGTISTPYNVKFNNDINVKGSVIITSSSAGEFSHESMDLKGSLFTHYLVSGLLGASDLDADGNITLWEVYGYANTNVQREGMKSKDFRQSPNFDIDVRGTENLILTQVNKGSSILRFIGCMPGKYKVLNSTNIIPVAEVYINNNKPTNLALPIGTYIIQHNTDDAAFISTADLSWGGSLTVSGKSFKPHPLDVFTTKGISSLQYKPYTVSIQVALEEKTPIGGEYTVCPTVEFSKEFNRKTIALSSGFSDDRISGTFFTVKRRTIPITLDYRYAFINKARTKISTGPYLRYIAMRQELIRPMEESIRAAGYGAIPITWGSMVGFGFGFYAQINLPFSLSVSIENRPGVLLSTTREGKTELTLRLPITLSLGCRF
ncbi:MAG: caspase family protein [Fibrobacteres bacterium]|nr:caspase family protein [Fibrobacterota bacterium]